MKKILFASTALVASAGFAAADIDFSGSASLGLGYDGSDWAPIADATLSVAMSGETDGGLSFGANFDITAGADSVDAAVVYIEGGFGKLSGGDVGSAVDAKLGIGDIGFDGLGVDNVAEAGIDGTDRGNLMYEGSFGDFGVAVSYDMAGSEDASVVATYAMGDYSIGLGYVSYSSASFHGFSVDFDDRQSGLAVALGANVGDLSLAALYTTSSLDGDADVTVGNAVYADEDMSDMKASTLGLTASYNMGAATITAGYAVAKLTDEDNVEAYGLGVSYDLGGGATFAAGVADVDGTTVADLGISMSF